MEENTIPASLTPMLQQYYTLKQKAEDAILFFRMGDFYEIFGDDAEKVAPILDIVLTSREKNKDGARIPFCGVPHHSARSYWFKLLSLGFKVAIGDQMEEASAAKGLVRRDISKILTPGCIDELEGLNPLEPNYLISVYENPQTKNIGITLADISTGEFRAALYHDLHELPALIEAFRPKELLCRRFFFPIIESQIKNVLQSHKLTLSYFGEHILASTEEQLLLLKEAFPCFDDLKTEPEFVATLLPTISGSLAHFKNLQLSIKQFLAVKPMQEPETMSLDEHVLRDLEIFETSRRRQNEGSLFSVINHCMTPMGTRLLRACLCQPLRNVEKILERHTYVKHFIDQGEVELGQLRAHLKGCHDLERLAIKLNNQYIDPLQLDKVRRTLVKIKDLRDQAIKNNIKPLLALLEAPYIAIAPLLAKLENSLKTEIGELGSGDQVFAAGVDRSLDESIALMSSGNQRIEEYAQNLRQQTLISSLKIREHKNFGLLIEVTKTHLAKIPDFFIRKQTMVNNERFTTVDLKELEEYLSTASDKAREREVELYARLLEELAPYAATLKQLAQVVAYSDFLFSLAWLALKNNYVQPAISTHGVIQLRGSRHPVVEVIVGQHNFIANDLGLDSKRSVALITGPNMGGKSTYMRQVALSALLAQIGSFVPAVAATLPVFDRIFTRVGASDDLALGQSTFMVEMVEAAKIMRYATKESLIILDEVGRGTSTQDGLALAYAILKYLAEKTKCYCLFSTHYHELVNLTSQMPEVRLLKTEVTENDQGIVFTHQVIDGSCDSSFGLEVAKLAGIPTDVLVSAKSFISEHFQKDAHLLPSFAPEAPKSSPVNHEVYSQATNQLLEDRYHTLNLLKERLEGLVINKTTPIQALNILASLQDEMVGPKRPKKLFDHLPTNIREI